MSGDKIWVVENNAEMPIGVRLTEQDVVEAVLVLAKTEFEADDEHRGESSDSLVVIPEFDGDYLVVKVFIGMERRFPYMIIFAFAFYLNENLKGN